MKRAKSPSVVLSDGGVKATLRSERASNPGLVRLDWLRFTASLEAIIAACPSLPLDLEALALMDQRGRDLVRDCRAAEGSDVAVTPVQVSRAGAEWICSVCRSLSVGPSDDRGMDYYSARTALMVEGELVGWVLAGGKSFAQASTVHFNLMGSACLRLGQREWHLLSQWIDRHGCTITRADLALDIWQGFDVGALPDVYLSGAFDVRGKRPTQSQQGSWVNGYERTFYVGSRDTGKLLRAYEKGHQLFGHEAGDPWVRVEVEFRNKHRVLSPDLLIRPADYFAGAYKWCADLLASLNAQAQAQRIATTSRVVDATVHAAAHRVAKWVKRTAAPALVAMLSLGGELLDVIVRDHGGKLPGRLAGFSSVEIRQGFTKVLDAVSPDVSMHQFAGV